MNKSLKAILGAILKAIFEIIHFFIS